MLTCILPAVSMRTQSYPSSAACFNASLATDDESFAYPDGCEKDGQAPRRGSCVVSGPYRQRVYFAMSQAQCGQRSTLEQCPIMMAHWSMNPLAGYTLFQLEQLQGASVTPALLVCTSKGALLPRHFSCMAAWPIHCG